MIALLAVVLAVTTPDNAQLANSDQDVAKQYALAIQRLRHCRANTTECYYWRRAIPRLQREQAAWKTWRDARVALMAVEMEETSGLMEVRSGILQQLNKSRADELSKIGRR